VFALVTGKGVRVLPLGELEEVGEGQVTRSENLGYFGGGLSQNWVGFRWALMGFWRM
jgi:hypothetical protein